MKRVYLTLAALALGVSIARADEVVLVNGGKLEGRVTTDPKRPGKLVIEVGAGTIVLDEKDVSSRSAGKTKLDEYDQRWNKIRNSGRAEDFYKLAVWARENKLTRHVRPLAEKVISMELNHEGSRRLLGQRRVGDKWLTFEEEMAEKGFVFFEGRWILNSEKELIEQERIDAAERRRLAGEERKRQKEEDRRRRLEAVREYYEDMEREARLARYRRSYRSYDGGYGYGYGRRLYYGGYWGDAMPTINVLDFVTNPFFKR